MALEVIEIANKLINLFDRYIKNWINGTYVITAKSGGSISYNAGPHLFDAAKTKLTYEDYLVFIPDDEFNNWIKEYFVEINKKQKVNRLTFVFENKIFISLNADWDQTVQDEFEQLLPKSLKGKTRAWYLPIEEGPASQQPPETNVKAMLKKHVAQLPSKEETIPLTQLNGKSLQELYRMYDPYVRDTTTSLWDGGLIGIKNDITGQFSGDLAL